jgi:G3E family GTPase
MSANVHLVGGFLGSGKTTAIATAARMLVRRGRRVGIITNDQGRHLVDTAFLRALSLPVVEVTGGCFCCNFTEFEQVFARLTANSHPDVIFAEAVGTCADIVTTVLQPLLRLGGKTQDATVSILVDARFLQLFLAGTPLPFNPDITYIFEKQLEEAGVLVVNKKDLLTDSERKALLTCTRERFPAKTVLLQDGRDEKDIGNWLDSLVRPASQMPAGLDLDYRRYGSGETRLAWNDLQVHLTSEKEIEWLPILEELMIAIKAQYSNKLHIAHLKLLAETGGSVKKLSLTALDEAPREETATRLTDREARLTINLRAEGGAVDARRIVADALAEMGRKRNVGVELLSGEAFQPKPPVPTESKKEAV